MTSQYRLGLKESVQETMANNPELTTFVEFSQLAIEIDNRQYGYAMTRYGNKPSSAQNRPLATHHAPTSIRTSSPMISVPKTTTTMPMDMDLSQARHGPLLPAERIRRQKEELCTYYASADPWSEGCSKKPSKSLYRNASVATPAISALQPTPNEKVISFQLGKDQA
ncbi:hypothetical protein EC968_004861 [Mortierella alpina]|nr:hypothetical protein EC968_004861 [Mortierella alpina]